MSAAAGSVVRALEGEPTVRAAIRLHAATLQSLAEALQQRALEGSLDGLLLYRPPGSEAAVSVTADDELRRTEVASWPSGVADEWFLIVTGVDYPLVLAGRQSDAGGVLDVLCSTEPRIAARAADLVLALLARSLPDDVTLPRTAPSPAGLCDFLVVLLLERLDTAERGVEAADSDVLEALELERRRIAAALHDGPVQELTAALLFLDGATQQPGHVSADLVARGTDALRSAVESCRAMMDHLAPPLADAHELPIRVERRVEAMRQAGAAPAVAVAASEQLQVDDPRLALGIYRVVDVLLDNVRRHAAGALERVTVTREGTEIVALVADRGPGCPTDAADAGVHSLALARRSVARFGGTLRIQSQPTGTVVTARWPAPRATHP